MLPCVKSSIEQSKRLARCAPNSSSNVSENKRTDGVRGFIGFEQLTCTRLIHHDRSDFDWSDKIIFVS